MTQFFNQLICPKTHTKLVLSADGKTLSNTSTEVPVSYDVNDIVDLVYPRELFEQDRKEQVAYNDAHTRHDQAGQSNRHSRAKADGHTNRSSLAGIFRSCDTNAMLSFIKDLIGAKSCEVVFAILHHQVDMVSIYSVIK